MKILTNITTLLSIICLAVVSFSSCDNSNDWSSDQRYNRLFRSNTLAVTPQTFTAEVTWSVTPNTDYYIIEVNKNEFTDDELQEGSIIYGEDKSITASPYSITGLEEQTTYYLRLRSCSATAQPSKWSTLDDGTFTTKSEQIIEGVANVTSKNATISWTAGTSDVTHFIIESTEGKTQRNISDAEKSAGKATLTDLKAATSYKVSIYNNTKLRGSCKFETTEDFPEGYTIINLKEGDDIDAALTGQEGDIVLVFPAGSTFERTEKLSIPAKVNAIIFWGASGEQQANFKPKEVTAGEGTTSVKFYNMNLYNAGKSGDYMINQDAMATNVSFIFDKCNVSKTRGILRVQGGGVGCSINSIEFTNTTFSEIGSYGIINTKDMEGNLNSIHISKCTFNDVAATDGPTFTLTAKNTTNPITFDIEQSTFYACDQKSGKHFIDANKVTVHTINITKCLFAKCGSSDAKNKLCSVKDIVKETSDNWYTTDCAWHSEGAAMCNEYSKTSADLFEDPDNGNFKIKDALFKNRAGDPQWFSE